MKKLLLAAVFSAAMISSQAQSTLEIHDHNGNVVPSGSVFDYYIPISASSHTVDFDFYNISSNRITYNVRKTNVVKPAGSYSWYCMFHNGLFGDAQSHCYDTATTNCPDVFMTDGGEFNRLQADFYPGSTSYISIVRYVVYDDDNWPDSASITLVYHASPAGISDNGLSGISFSEAYPNPANDFVQFNCSAPEGEFVTVSITDLKGAIVKSMQVATINGVLQINLGELSQGMYFCRFGINETEVAVRRISIVE
jgi:hypothetical protein